MTSICIVGSGHVGVMYGVAFTLHGHQVVATDIDAKTIESLRNGRPTFYEPGLREALPKALESNRLAFSTDVRGGARRSEVVFLCVGTPSRRDGSIDLRYVKAAAKAVGEGMRSAADYQVVATKSTVLPGTTEDVVRPILEKASGKKAGRTFGLCANPEFLREGSALEDALKPDRIVIGGLDERSAKALEQVYAGLRCPRMITDLKTAEAVKYATNAFLATKVSFANELANLCDAFGAINVDAVVEGIGMDPRINPKFLKAGLGFGGFCFPKDVRALAAAGRRHGYRPRLIEAVLELNDRQPLRAVALAQRALGSLRGTRVAILGLSFKGNSDDVRDSRAIPLAEALLSKGATVVGYDPAANEAFHRAVPGVEIAPDVASALAQADVCVVHNDWPAWRDLTAAEFAGMRRKVVIDGRRILNRAALRGIELIVLGG